MIDLEKYGIENTNPCNRKVMGEYLRKIHALQTKAAGKVTMWVITPRNKGAIFGGFVREVGITVEVTLMDVFNDPNEGKDGAYQRDFTLYEFYEKEKNDATFNELKSEVDRIVKEYDKEYMRRLKNMVKRRNL